MGFLFPFGGEAVLPDSLHHIRSSPVVTGQCVLQSEGAVSGPSDSFTHCRATQLESYLMHDFAQIFLSFIQTLHLCEDREREKKTQDQ